MAPQHVGGRLAVDLLPTRQPQTFTLGDAMNSAFLKMAEIEAREQEEEQVEEVEVPSPTKSKKSGATFLTGAKI